MSGNMAAWRKQNSTPVLAEVRLVDGTLLKGTILVQRDQTMKELFCGSEPFVEFECSVSGEMVVSKSSIATARTCKQISADQLDRRNKLLDKSDAFGVLKLPKTADRDKVREGYLALARAYHPDRYTGSELPPEVIEYLNAMTRRINAAYSELNMLMGPTAANDADVAA